MLVDNDEKEEDVWFHGFLYGTIVGTFAGIAIAGILLLDL
jgi:hypothetical protein